MIATRPEKWLRYSWSQFWTFESQKKSTMCCWQPLSPIRPTLWDRFWSKGRCTVKSVSTIYLLNLLKTFLLKQHLSVYNLAMPRKASEELWPGIVWQIHPNWPVISHWGTINKLLMSWDLGFADCGFCVFFSGVALFCLLFWKGPSFPVFLFLPFLPLSVYTISSCVCVLVFLNSGLMGMTRLVQTLMTSWFVIHSCESAVLQKGNI